MTIAPEDMVLISIDDHTIEPPDLFERHVPSRLAAEAPRVVSDEATGDCFWEYAGTRMPNIGIGSVAGRPNVAAGRAPKAGAQALTYGDMKLAMASILTGGKTTESSNA